MEKYSKITVEQNEICEWPDLGVQFRNFTIFQWLDVEVHLEVFRSNRTKWNNRLVYVFLF